MLKIVRFAIHEGQLVVLAQDEYLIRICLAHDIQHGHTDIGQEMIHIWKIKLPGPCRARYLFSAYNRFEHGLYFLSMLIEFVESLTEASRRDWRHLWDLGPLAKFCHRTLWAIMRTIQEWQHFSFYSVQVSVLVHHAFTILTERVNLYSQIRTWKHYLLYIGRGMGSKIT